MGISTKRLMRNEQIAELLYQALETEAGGIQVYETALKCADNADLKKEWEEYLEQTKEHQRQGAGPGHGDGSHVRTRQRRDRRLRVRGRGGDQGPPQLGIESLGMPAVLPPPE